MTKKQAKNADDYIERLNMNRLRGRMLRLSPPRGKKSREILVVYGHHSNLEMTFPLAVELNKYGSVTVPDMPGFGGMQSFYRLGDRPTIDNLADYLAAFIKLFYKRRRLTIIGLSFGFVVVTRMLQKYPELAKRVDLLISIGGYSRYDDFKMTTRNKAFKRTVASIFSKRIPAAVVQKVFLRPVFIKSSYKLLAKAEQGKSYSGTEQLEDHIAQAVQLWHMNDLRTYMNTSRAILSLDICKDRVSLPVHHLVSREKRFKNNTVEQHLNVIYESVQVLETLNPKKKSTPAKSSQLPASLQRLLRNNV